MESDINKQANFLKDIIREAESDPDLSPFERALLKAAAAGVEHILKSEPQDLGIPQIEFQPIPKEEWTNLSQYLYVSKSGRRELRIPFSDITYKEMSCFKEVVIDWDNKLVVIKL